MKATSELSDTDDNLEKRIEEEERLKKKLERVANVLKCYIHIFNLRFNKNGVCAYYNANI